MHRAALSIRPPPSGKWRRAESETSALCAAKPFDRREDRSKGHPQERKHSDGEAGARYRMPPTSGTIFVARGIEAGWRRRVGGSVHESPIGLSRTRHDFARWF